MRSRSERQVLWPAYFDLRLSRLEGRMVPKAAAVQEPTSEEILQAAKKCGYSCELEADKAFPREWYKTRGRVVVAKKDPKPVMLRKVSAELKRIRTVSI